MKMVASCLALTARYYGEDKNNTIPSLSFGHAQFCVNLSDPENRDT